MDWRAPFNALTEIFPQVDNRIIKAVALEHPNDIDSAVEFILNEVIPNQEEKIATYKLERHNEGPDGIPDEWCDPFLSEQTTSSSQESRFHSELIPNHNEKLVIHEPDNDNVGMDGIPGERCHQLLSQQSMTGSQESRFHSDTNDGTFEVFDDIVLKDLNAVINNSELLRSCLPDNTFNDLENIIRESNSPPAPMALLLNRQLFDRSFGGTSSLVLPFDHGESKDNGIAYTGLSGQLSGSVDEKEHRLVENEDDFLDSGEQMPTEFEGPDGVRMNGNCFLGCSSDAVLPGMDYRANCLGDLEDSTSQIPCTGSTSLTTFEVENPSIEGSLVKKSVSPPSALIYEETNELFDVCHTSDTENMNCRNKDNDFTVDLHSESSLHIAEENSLSGSRVSSSSQIVSADMLEGLVTEAKKNKELLIEAMDIIRSLRTKADSEEIAAQCAKDEALKGGADILDKVEELRQAIAQAKETNDMHAGEVYGEKAILVTEARELRSRLAHLVADKEKAFCMIDKIRENLEARIDVAKREREAAEKEKVKKEESARKVLAMEEALMAKVAHDARELELDAEANSKLREFLIDQGQIVDALQGEVAVLCEDVKLLKDQIDGGIPAAGNGFMNIQRPISVRHQNTMGHYRCQSLKASFNQDASNMSEQHKFSNELKASLKSYGINFDNGISGTSLLCWDHGGSLYESVESTKMQGSVASSGRLSVSIPDIDNPSCTLNGDVERDYLSSRETSMVQTDMEMQDSGLQSSISCTEAKQQHCPNLDDEWQFLEDFRRKPSKSGSNSDSSGGTAKTKRS